MTNFKEQIKWTEDTNYKFWAMDKDGGCSFYEQQPFMEDNLWDSFGDIYNDEKPPIDRKPPDWKDSLTERPRVKQVDDNRWQGPHKIIPEGEPLELPTLRDQFAMAALPKSMEIVWENKDQMACGNLDQLAAKGAYNIADAMIIESKK